VLRAYAHAVDFWQGLASEDYPGVVLHDDLRLPLIDNVPVPVFGAFDTYTIVGMGPPLSISDKDKKSIDRVDFSASTVAVTVDLNSSKAQAVLGGQLRNRHPSRR
jgi:hypothetical protein